MRWSTSSSTYKPSLARSTRSASEGLLTLGVIMQDAKIDISHLARDLVELIAAINVRLDQLRQEHIAAGEALGLTLTNGKPKKTRRPKSHDAA